MGITSYLQERRHAYPVHDTKSRLERNDRKYNLCDLLRRARTFQNELSVFSSMTFLVYRAARTLHWQPNVLEM